MKGVSVSLQARTKNSVRTCVNRFRRCWKWPPLALVPFVSLKRKTPLSRVFGYDRGPQSVARYFIENFIAKFAGDIQGHVLEIGDNEYTSRFGGNRVTKSDVLNVEEGDPVATIVADLTKAEDIPSDTFDCIVLTQTLQCIYHIETAVRNLERILKPSGVLLVTLSGISQISRYDMERWGEWWRFTDLSAERLFKEVFPPLNVQVETFGNVAAAAALLYGLASNEVSQKTLDYNDPDYQVIIGVRAVKQK